jgi:transcriptional regulator with XRE-family HTH domain
MSKKDLKVCERLVFERKRLNLNQKDFSIFLQMSGKQVGRWENEAIIPADKLGALSELGVDVNYVVTGNRQSIDVLILTQSLNEVGSSVLLTDLDNSTRAKIIASGYSKKAKELSIP